MTVKHQKNILRTILAFGLVGGLYGIIAMAQSEVKQERVWPLPPDTPRFVYERSVIKADDLQISRSVWRKIWDFLAGNEEQVLNVPFGLHVGNDGKLFVSDSGAPAVFIFDRQNNGMKVIEGMEVIEGGGEQPFVSPIDLSTDGKGNLYVSDSGLAKVFVFDSKNRFVRTIGTEEILGRPTGIAVDPTENKLYVVDTLKSCIHLYSLEGSYLKTFGKEGNRQGEFNKPTYIAIGRNGDLYVVDTMNHRVQVLDKEGNFIRMFGQLGDQIGDFASPRGIALDEDQNIYVSDTLFNAVQIFNPQGELLLVIGEYGDKKGEFSAPKDLFMDKSGTLYIADALNSRIQMIKKLPNPDTRIQR